jgi:glutathione S-transferase
MYTLHYAPDNASLIIRLVLETHAIPYRTVLVNRAARRKAVPSDPCSGHSVGLG